MLNFFKRQKVVKFGNGKWAAMVKDGSIWFLTDGQRTCLYDEALDSWKNLTFDTRAEAERALNNWQIDEEYY